MKMNKLLMLCALALFSSLSAHKYELAVCAIFQDEGPYLKEWIEFHRMVGVKHFWLYNNNSTDDYLKTLKPYIKKGIVELTDWPSNQQGHWLDFQNSAYADCLKRSLGVAKWVAAIDLDEFIVPVHDKYEVLTTLRALEKSQPQVGGVMLFWQFFGTSRLYDIPEGKTMVESLLWKAKVDYPGNHQVKTICRPEFVEKIVVHFCIYKPGSGDITLNGHWGPSTTVYVDPLRIHHYFPRTEKYLLEKKIPRRGKYQNKPFTKEEIDQEFQRFDKDLNEVYDDTMLKYVPELKQRLKEKQRIISTEW